ncbi:phage tail sheath C-terminal domain-containing protein [Salsipaludibacter albus]|uniref:phage tail sheath family protein n=1 Tax=Salsipaludibacter albus TaxID=2849650 RepID=UPI001EE4E2A5|nr:phage tail sheath subtilisin-like domain-containing protein [Salsipaludibacter albus]
MPVELRHPGVYIEELPSGVRTITGVATSVTAFVGRALRGDVDTATTITSFGDFERVFGGLWRDSSLGYAVRDFFTQGGSTAVVVRVHEPAADDVAALTVGADTGALALVAASPGAWGGRLTAQTDVAVGDPDDDDLFNLTITDTGTGAVEQHLNVSIGVDSPRRIDTVLDQRSNLVRVSGDLPTTNPGAAGPEDATGGNDGGDLTDANYTTATGMQDDKLGLYALEDADLVNLIVVPPYTDPGAGVPVTEGGVDAQVVTDTIAYAEARRAMVVLDPPSDWASVDDAEDDATATPLPDAVPASKNAVMYFPRIRKPDPLRDLQLGTFAPSGAIAGVIARTDTERGVWKAPAGLDATVRGVSQLEIPLTDAEVGRLNPHGINCLRAAPAAGHVVWGARTRVGSDRLASEWKYVPVRRTALFLEESLYRGTQWVVFEPNDEPLWSQVRLNIGAFLTTLFRQGAFAGSTPREAFFVKCDAETTTQADIDLGRVNIVVGFAPLKPAEFVVISLQQLAGQDGGA